MYVDGKLRRSFRNGVSDIEGVADDYACLIDGIFFLVNVLFIFRIIVVV